MTQEPSIETTPISGLLVVNLPLLGDNRGWFKEHWQRAKMVALGLPDFGPVQQNISFNAAKGTTRGIHAEPWDKYVSVASGRAFGAWVDLRAGEGFGSSFTIELTPQIAVFVPRGVANAFQTLDDDTAYMYLVNAHWSPNATYTYLNVADPTVSIEWPIPLSSAILSDKDLHHPYLADVTPSPERTTLVLGSDGQLGRALREVLPAATTRFLTRNDLDLADLSAVHDFDFSNVGAIINAAAFTAVDAAETPEGSAAAWAINASAVAELALAACSLNAVFVNVSTDYVFDGTQETHAETEPLNPLNAYGQSKAAGEMATRIAPRHYLVRTSWVVGEGKNFVQTMKSLALGGASPTVVNDQFGRLTFANELARAIAHLLHTDAPFGIYHVSNGGSRTSWYDVAVRTFELCGHSPTRVKAITTEDYSLSSPPSAPRPTHSTLDLAKIKSTGFVPVDWDEALRGYLSS